MTSDELQSLRVRCRARMDKLSAQLPFDRLSSVEELCAVLAAQRGRPLLPQAAPLPPWLAGAWVALERADYIFYAQDAPRPHQEHIVLHELAHLLCEHESSQSQIELLEALLFPHLDHALVRTAFGRARFDTFQEREAEFLATLMEHRWLRPRARRESSNMDRVAVDKSDDDRDTAERLSALARNLGTHHAL